jgi:hypothetical protein
MSTSPRGRPKCSGAMSASTGWRPGVSSCSASTRSRTCRRWSVAVPRRHDLHAQGVRAAHPSLRHAKQDLPLPGGAQAQVGGHRTDGGAGPAREHAPRRGHKRGRLDGAGRRWRVRAAEEIAVGQPRSAAGSLGLGRRRCLRRLVRPLVWPVVARSPPGRVCHGCVPPPRVTLRRPRSGPAVPLRDAVQRPRQFSEVPSARKRGRCPVEGPRPGRPRRPPAPAPAEGDAVMILVDRTR